MYDINDNRLVDYRNADEEKRLAMYLQFPRLRSEFYRIDEQELRQALSAGREKQRRPVSVHLNAVAGTMASAFKKFMGLAAT